MLVSASATPLQTNFEATRPNLMPPPPLPPPQDMSDSDSACGILPLHSVSPPQDSNKEPVDDDNDDDWEDVHDNIIPPSPKKVAQKQIPQLGNTNDDGELPEVTGVTTWAQCDPRKHVIPVHVHPKHVIRPEQHRTLNNRAKNKKGQKAALYAKITELNEEHDEKLPVLVKKHGFKVKLVQQQMAAAMTYKKEDKVNMYHAKLFYLSKLLDKD